MAENQIQEDMADKCHPVYCNEATAATATMTVTDSPGHDIEQTDQMLAYIIVVLLFYSLGLIIMMAKYMQSEKEELKYSEYYSEYVDRGGFSAKQHMKIKKKRKREMQSKLLVKEKTDERTSSV